MKHGLLLPCVMLALLALAPIGALEVSQGRMRLCLQENTGRFTLYYLNEKEGLCEPLFSDQDPRTSFAAINIDDRIFRLGESASMHIRVEEGASPAYVFESPTLVVREEFSFINTPSSSVSDGLQITLRVINRQPKPANIGLRFLLDTYLGEKDGDSHFYINNRAVISETIIEGNSERWWVSRNGQISLMGSAAIGGKAPDYIYFANWKRLNEASWKPVYAKGRNFNYLPYSIQDSAVCYYFDPKPVPPNGELTCLISLGIEDPSGFESPKTQAVAPVPVKEKPPAPTQIPPAYQGREVEFPIDKEDPSRLLGIGNSREADLALLRSLIERLDMYINGKIEISKEELAAIELTISLIKARYNFP